MSNRSTRNLKLIARIATRFGLDRCGVCGKIRSDGKTFCSDQCLRFLQLLASYGKMRQVIFTRGTCGICGRHMGQTSEERRDAVWAFDDSDEYVQIDTITTVHWVVDHIRPLTFGGPQFDLRNLQLLCPQCNRKKTHFDISRSWKRRRSGDDEIEF